MFELSKITRLGKNLFENCTSECRPFEGFSDKSVAGERAAWPLFLANMLIRLVLYF
jgi:hypothetical protein